MTTNTPRKWAVLAAGLTAILLAGCSTADGNSGGSSDASGTTELKFATYIGESASEMQAMVWFADELESRTDGQYTIQPFYSESLLKATDIMSGVAQGRADIGFTNPSGYHPAELSLTSINELPFHWKNPAAHAGALQELHANNEAFRKQYEDLGVHVLYFAPNAESIVASKEQVQSLDDLSGLKLRAIGKIAEALTNVGVSVVSIPSSEIYQAVEQGLLDGFTAFPFATVPTMSLHEVSGAMTDIGTGNYGLGVVVMGAEEWNDLPEDVKTVFNELSAEAMVKTIETNVEAQDAACEQMTEAGLTMYAWPQDQIDELAEAANAEGMAAAWVAEQDKAGLPGQDVFDEYSRAYESIAAENPYTTAVARCMGN